jgi:competence protein ComEC
MKFASKLSHLYTQLARVLEQEQETFFYWLPVFFGMGIGCYFLLSFEPSVTLAVTLVALTAILLGGMLRRQSFWLYKLATLAFVMAAGFAVITLRANVLATPMLKDEIGYQAFEGVIEKVERMPRYSRITLGQIKFYFPLSLGEVPPIRVRVTARGTLQPAPSFVPGMKVKAAAVLKAPGGPVVPGGYNFRRYAFFAQIGAVGFLVKPLTAHQQQPHLTVTGWIAQKRAQLTQYLRHSIPGENGALVAALITGDRSGITDTTRQAYADAGLAHILAISGLHLSLVAGFIFLMIRGTLSFIPPVVLKYNTKKIAAACALLFTFVYLILSGLSIPAQRAFIMTSVVLLAVMTDRIALTMRNVALAALVVLVIMPEALISISFQLSFAAVIALVAVYEKIHPRLLKVHMRERKVVTRLGLYIGGLILTSLIATLATAPLTVFTFNRFSLVAVWANLIAVPVVSFLLMPLIVMMLLTAPLTMDFFAPLMNLLLGCISQIASYAQGLPGAVILVPQVPLAAQLFTVLGLLWLALWRTKIRFAGIGGLVIAGVIFIMTDRPTFYIPPHYGFIGVFDAQGQAWITNRQKERFARKAWMQAMGVPELKQITEKNKPAFDAALLSDLFKQYLNNQHDDKLEQGGYYVYLKGSKVIIKRASCYQKRLWS